MKKLLSIVLALALVLGMLPVFAAETFDVEMTGAKNLKHYGFIQGDQNGDLGEMKNLTREQLTIVLSQLYGKYDEAKAFEAASGFADEAKFPKWSKNFISYAKSQKWMVGDKSNNFNNKGIVSDKALATVLLRVLEYPETEFTWKTAVDVLKAKTGIEIAGDKLTRGEAFEAIWKAVSTPVMFVKDGEAPKYLGVEVGKLDIAIITPPVKDLAIDSVSADNLKEIKVNFNQQINKDKLGNFSIKGLKLTAALSEDAMSVVLTADKTLKENFEYTLSVKDTEAVDEKAGKLAKTEVKFSTLDKERPTVEKVEFSGPKNITITFSEPIQEAGKLDVVMGKVKVSVNNVSTKADGTSTVNVALYSNLQDGKEYTVSVKGFKDFNNLHNIEKEVTATYKKDTEAPTVSILEVTQENMVIEFSKPVKGLKPEFFHHNFTKYEAFKLSDMDGAPVTSATEIKKVNVVFYVPDDAAMNDKIHQPIAAGNAKIMIDGDTIKDLWGNKLGNFEEMKVVVADTEVPVVKSAKVMKNDADEDIIRVTFSKAVNFNKTKSFSVMFNSKDYFKSAKAVKAHVVDITIKSDVVGKVVTLEIDKVTDQTVNKNKLAPYSEAIEIIDGAAPVVKKITYKADAAPAKTGKLYVFFEKLVDANALEVSNYQLVDNVTGKYTQLDGDVEFFENSSIVEIKLDKDQYELASTGGTNLFVDKVKSVAGIEIVNKLYAIDGEHVAENKLGITSAKAIAMDTVRVEFNQDVYDIKATDFADLTVGGKAKQIVDHQANVVIVKYTNALGGASVGNITDTLNITAGTIKAQFDTVANALGAPVAIKDQIAPKVDKVEKNDRKIKITFNKQLAAENVIANIAQDIKILYKAKNADEFVELNAINEVDAVFDAIGANATEVEAEIKGQLDGTFKVVIKGAEHIKSNVTAANGVAQTLANTTGADAEKAVLDFENPTIEKVDTKVDTTAHEVTLTIKFSEKLDPAAVATKGNYEVKKAPYDSTAGGNAGIKSATLSADEMSIVLVIQADNGSNNPETAMVDSATLMVQNMKDKNNNTMTAKTFTLKVEGTVYTWE